MAELDYDALAKVHTTLSLARRQLEEAANLVVDSLRLVLNARNAVDTLMRERPKRKPRTKHE